MTKPNRLYQYLTTYTALLAMITGGMHYAWPSPSLPQLIDNSTGLQITTDEGSWIAILELMGSISSCFFAAAMTDIIGRKYSVIATAIPYLAAWILIAYADSVAAFCIGRFLAGISDGIAFTVIPLYIGEIADPQIRGLLGSSISTTWIFGMLLINIVGVYFTIRNAAFISSVVPVLLLVTFVWMPESPHFLVYKNRLVQARESLIKLKGHCDVSSELERIQEAVRLQKENTGNCLEIFTNKINQKALGIMMVLRNAQQLSGVAAISFYTLTIFQESGDFVSPVMATTFFVATQCLMSSLCSVIIDKTGRRPLLITSLIGSALCLFTLGLYFYLKVCTEIDTDRFNFVPVVALLGYVIIFNLGMQPIPLLMQGELFAPKFKAYAGSFSEVYFSVVAAIVSKFFQMMNDAVGMYLPFFVFSLCCVVNLVFIVIFIPETKGKTLEEIQVILEPQPKRPDTQYYGSFDLT